MLFSIIIGIALAGVLMYLINTYLPMDEKFKNLLNVVAIIALVFWIIVKLNVMSYLGGL